MNTGSANDTPDFVVKRKRKRSYHAIDPCLGFYRDIASSPASTTLLVTQNPPKCGPKLDINAEETPPSTGRHWTRKAIPTPEISSPTGRSSEAALTVEEFLRKSVTKKRYTSRLRRRHIVPSSPHGDLKASVPNDLRDSDYHNSSQSSQLSDRSSKRRAIWTSDEDDHAPPKPVKKKRHRQKKAKTQSLSVRILAAAVATGVDVVGGALLPCVEKTGVRRPLSLIPDKGTLSPIGRVTGRRRYVDPRTTAPFGRAVFQFGSAEEQQPMVTRRPRPVTAWRPDRDGRDTSLCARDAPHDRAQRGLLVNTGPRLVTNPLKLSAMAACPPTKPKRLLPSKPLRGIAKQTKNGGNMSALNFEPSSPLSPPKRRTAAPGLHFVGDSHTSFFVPNSSPNTGEPASEWLATDAAESDQGIDSSTINAQYGRGDTASCTIQAPSNSASATPATIAELGRVPEPSAQAILLAQPDDMPHPLAYPSQSSGTPFDVMLAPKTAGVSQSTSRKPLKALGSMLDNFREIARSATLASGHGRFVRARPHISARPKSPETNADIWTRILGSPPNLGGVGVAPSVDGPSSTSGRPKTSSPRTGVGRQPFQAITRRGARGSSPQGGAPVTMARRAEDEVSDRGEEQYRREDPDVPPMSSLPRWNTLYPSADDCDDGGDSVYDL